MPDLRRLRNPDLDVELKRRLRVSRLAMNMSQGDLAKAASVSFQQVQKYEKGANRLSLSMAVVMCTALGWRVMDLVGDLDLEGG